MGSRRGVPLWKGLSFEKTLALRRGVFAAVAVGVREGAGLCRAIGVVMLDSSGTANEEPVAARVDLDVAALGVSAEPQECHHHRPRGLTTKGGRSA